MEVVEEEKEVEAEEEVVEREVRPPCMTRSMWT